MNDFGANYPSDNHWGNLPVKDAAGKNETGKNYSLQVQAPAKEITGLDKSITEICATMSAVLEDGSSDLLQGKYLAKQTQQQRQKATEDNKTALYDRIQAQADAPGSNLELVPDSKDSPTRIFDDHGELKFALSPMATAIIKASSGEVTMIVGWRGSVRGGP